MLFQLVLTKFFKSELFSCLLKVDHVIKSCKGPIAVVNCKTSFMHESLVTCNVLWEQFKTADERKMVKF